MPSLNFRSLTIRGLFSVALTLFSAAVAQVEQPAETDSKRPSFLDPVCDFGRDAILRPKTPFELVPGKDPNGWGFVIEPYVWAMGLSGSTGVEGLPPLAPSLDASKILQNLNWAVMAAGEVRKGRWGLLADGFYADLSASGKLGGTLYESGAIDVQQGLASLSLAYRVIDDRRGFLDVYAGARYNYLGVQVYGNTDSNGIQNLSNGMIDRVAQQIDRSVQQSVDAIRNEVTAEVAAARQTIENRLIATLESDLTGRADDRSAEESRSRPDDGATASLRASRNQSEIQRVVRSDEFRRLDLNPRQLAVVRRSLASDRSGVLSDYVRVSAKLDAARNREALAKRAVERVERNLAARAVERAAADVQTRVDKRLMRDLRERRLDPERLSESRNRDYRRQGLDPKKADVLRKSLRADRSGVFAKYIRASVDLEIARVQGEVTAELEQKAAAAKAEASKKLAENIEDALPTDAAGDEWWVDPIVGLRGQINFTRWLYLTAQADVGGFGAGSQITWNVIGALGVNFTRNISAELGYRYMYVDYTNDNFFYLMNSYGIYTSLGFRF